MNKIKQLSTNMINKIAAGEVIERPASVVKELVENSIDAGAKRIEVIIERSGFDLIRIQDDGCGIPSDQVPFALLPHATSKIVDTDDLFNITTFGFRGEALASVAEISQFLLRSRVSDSPEGTEIRSEGGVLSGTVPCGMPVGTIIDVRNIFFNIPARRKYLKSVSTEFGHISEAFMRLAIPQIEIHFILKHNGRVIYDFPPVSQLSERISSLTGKQNAEKLLKVECSRGNIHIAGFVGHPDFNRNNAGFQYFFLNRRFIKDRSLQHALTEAYRGLLTVGRYPVAFLELDVPPNIIDVNVHPTKLEVRFLDSHLIYSCFLSAVREQLLLTDLSSRPNADEIANKPNHQSQNSLKEKVGSFSDENSFDPRQALDPELAETMRQNVLQWSNHCSNPDNSQDGLHFLRDDVDPLAENISNGTDPLSVKGISSSEELNPSSNSSDSSTLPLNDKDSLNFSGQSSNQQGKNNQSSNVNKYHSDSKPSDYALKSGNQRNQSTQFNNLSPFSGKKVPDFVPFPEKGSSFDFANSSRLKSPTSNSFSDNDSKIPATPQNSSQTDILSNLTESDRSVPSFNKNSGNLAKFNEYGGQKFLEKIAVNSKGEPVLQIHQRYLIMETADGLAIIDQHALHERILYEKIKAKMNQGRLDSQRLLVPEAVDLTPTEIACVLENKDFLANFGLLVDFFGGNTIVINGYPSILRHIAPNEILLTIIEPILKGNKKPNRSDLLDEMMHQMACKAAVKAGDLLRSDAIVELLALADQEINSHHCPHGRPSTLIISCKDIDKLFKRT